MPRSSIVSSIAAAALFLAAGPVASALEPEEVLIVVRGTMTKSGKVAIEREAKALLDHYRARRKVPKENFIAVDIKAGETIDRKDFDRLILAPIRAELAKDGRAKVRCLLLLRGIPTRVGPGEVDGGGAPLDEETRKRRTDSTIASVDSELAAALSPPGTLEGSVANPLYVNPFYAPASGEVAPPAEPALGPNRPLLVARIDGPTLEIARGLIDKAIEGEKRGLDGLFCFDSRGIEASPGSYGRYDQIIRDAAALAQERGLALKHDDRPELFGQGEGHGPGDCEGVSFYVGWYSLCQYVDAFSFKPGAIAFHIASGEASSLVDGNAWCKRLLEDGATATFGPTDEPYLESMPDAAAFLRLLIDGRRTLAEIYWETVPHVSWRLLLVGDPLYRPRVVPPKPPK